MYCTAWMFLYLRLSSRGFAPFPIFSVEQQILQCSTMVHQYVHLFLAEDRNVNVVALRSCEPVLRASWNAPVPRSIDTRVTGQLVLVLYLVVCTSWWPCKLMHPAAE